MIKLIASDMDGTLLNETSQVSKENAAAIRYAQEQGIEFMVATGRGRTEASPVLAKAGLSLPMISVNGAQVYDQAGQIMFTIDIPKELVLQVITVLEKHQLYFELATTKGTFSNSHAMRITTTSNYLKEARNISRKMAIAMAAAHLELLHVHFVPDFASILADENLQILKFIVFALDDPGLLAVATDELNKLPHLTVTSSAKNNIEINHVNAQKGRALKRVAELKDIPLDEVMAIGDNFNDLSMLEVAGVSFAMANGPEAVHAYAKYLAPANSENGVAQAIHRAINENL